MGDGFAAQGIYEAITRPIKKALFMPAPKGDPTPFTKLCRRCFGTGVRYVPIEGGLLRARPCYRCKGTGVRNGK
jgi:hypothetical protein